jgi:apolipoprotein N-acyltransferase
LLMILPASWALSEWTRSWIFTGFPWLSTGYAHTASPLAGYAALVGVYGVGWIAALVAGYLAMLTLPRTSGTRSKLWIKVNLGIIAALLFFCGQVLRGVEWTQPQGNVISVRLLQGNIAQEMKFNEALLGSTLGFYYAMLTEKPADLIVTPETAIPITRQQLPPDYLPRLVEYARSAKSHLALGMPISDDPSSYTNGLLLLGPSMTDLGSPAYRYDKHHLVPFGEFIPAGFRWFVNFMHIPLGDQTRGAALQPPFRVNDQWVLPNICYEDLFGEEIAAQFRARLERPATMPTMMLNISNIAWFGDSIAVPQHLQISQMRTLETGRPMMRATNTGATAVIDPHGKVLTELAPFTRGELSTSVQGYGGMTVFLRFGNASIVLISFLMLTIPWLAFRIRKGSHHVR